MRSVGVLYRNGLVESPEVGFVVCNETEFPIDIVRA